MSSSRQFTMVITARVHDNIPKLLESLKRFTAMRSNRQDSGT